MKFAFTSFYEKMHKRRQKNLKFKNIILIRVWNERCREKRGRKINKSRICEAFKRKFTKDKNSGGAA